MLLRRVERPNGDDRQRTLDSVAPTAMVPSVVSTGDTACVTAAATARGSEMNAVTTDITLSNTESVPGRQIVEFYGVVTGNTVRAKHIGKDIMAGFKNIVGGELVSYTELLQEARNEALERMAEQARSVGANAVVNVRFATSSISQGASELFAYGTAVRLQ